MHSTGSLLVTDVEHRGIVVVMVGYDLSAAQAFLLKMQRLIIVSLSKFGWERSAAGV